MTIGVSIREFARLEGCSHTLVNRAVKQKRIKTLEDGSLDPALVGTPWRMANATGGNKAGNTGKSVSTSPRQSKPATAPPMLPPPGSADDDSLADKALSILAARGADLDYAEALRVKENYLALLRQLEYEQKSGALVALADAEGVFFEVSRAQRDSWLGWPAKIGPILAAELGVEEADRVTELLTVHVHKQISDLGEPDADFNPKKD